MTENISARRGATIAGFAALVLLVFLAAFDNQWLDKWRTGRSAEGGDATHSWIAGPVRGLSTLAWRATKEAGEPTRIFFGVMAEPLIAIVLTFLLLMLVCRGVGAQRGRWSLFLGSWFVTGLAASAALIAGSAIAGVGVAAGLADGPGDTRFGRGDIYYTLIAMGLAFGLFAGWLVGFVAVLVYGSTEAAEEPSSTREYPTSSSADYSFSPTSPYTSSASSSSGYGDGSGSSGYGGESSGYGYGSAEAPTEVSTPHESDPYGGANAY